MTQKKGRKILGEEDYRVQPFAKDVRQGQKATSSCWCGRFLSVSAESFSFWLEVITLLLQ